MRALLTGATHGIGEATARRLRPAVDALVLHGPEPEERVEPSLYELRESNASADRRGLRRGGQSDSVASSC